jgi:hypothetical protein
MERMPTGGRRLGVDCRHIRVMGCLQERSTVGTNAVPCGGAQYTEPAMCVTFALSQAVVGHV